MTYRDLFDVIGIMYGSGNDNDTFSLLDFCARFPLGSNENSSNGSLVARGASSHVITVAELPVHNHDQGSLITLTDGIHTHAYTNPGHNHGGSTGSGPFSSGPSPILSSGGAANDQGHHTHTIPYGTKGIKVQSDGSHTHTVQGLTDSQGARQPVDMMPPYQTIHYIIRA
jgi:microcystin-dependent protein